MTIYLEGDANITKKEHELLNAVGSSDFPWYLGMATKHFPCLTHVIMRRTDKKTEGEPWSQFYPATRAMFNRICDENGITIHTVYRMGFNLTFADPSKHGDPHIDHREFPHKHMLLYLSEFDAGETFIFDETGTHIIETIKPALNKFVVFEGGWHAQGFCRPQQLRIVFVATFDGDITPRGNS